MTGDETQHESRHEGEVIKIDQLFNTSWFKRNEKGYHQRKDLTFLIFYTPLGLIIFLIRLGILLQFLLLKSILPDSKSKTSILRFMGGMLGVTISTEGDILGSTFVANHVTAIDHFILHCITNSLSIIEDENVPISALRLFGLSPTLSALSQSEQSSSLTFFPEQESTNGEVGLLYFVDEISRESTNREANIIQPVSITVRRSFLNVNTIYSGLRSELFCIFFLPNTHYALKFLPPERWDSVKVQKSIASNLGVVPTKFRASDKKELHKKLLFRPLSVASMARLVQQQLQPLVLSPESIITALQKTGSVEEAVKELRKSMSQPSFHKNANERMMSFQERKRVMIQTAREKYAEKHGIQVQH